MVKKLSSAVLIAASFITNIHVSLGANEIAQFAESDEEISRAVTLLNDTIAKAKQQELKDLSMIDPKKSDGKLNMADAVKMITARKDELQKVKSYKDLQTQGSFDDVVKMLQDKGYPMEESSLSLYKEIDAYKTTNKISDPVAIVKYFNAQAGLKEKLKMTISGISFRESAHAYSISYSAWTKLTTSEKLLIASDPKAALITNSLSKLAFQWEKEKFGYNGLGDKADGFRHGSWNALMTRDISRAWAEAYATAHEDKTQAELQQKEIDGYYKYQHRNMDLNNNKIGRDQIAWYEYSFNCSDATVKSRINAKLTNKSGGIVWLHN